MTKEMFCVVTGAALAVFLTSAVSRADTYTPRAYQTSDNRGYTSEGDWDNNETKAECSNGERMVGVSGTNDSSNSLNGLFGYAALCDSSTTYYTDATSYHVHTRAFGDDRGDTSTGDWDVNAIKLECEDDEVMSGISQNGSYQVHGILCRYAGCAGHTSHYTSDETQCNTVMYNTGDNRLSYSDGDWSTGYLKGQCGDSQLLKGVSVNGDYTIHALLCCNSVSNACF